MYLWCSKCEKSTEQSRWHADKFKYGVCPSCGCSAYRNAVKWEDILKVSDYETIPLKDHAYTLNPTFEL